MLFKFFMNLAFLDIFKDLIQWSGNYANVVAVPSKLLACEVGGKKVFSLI